MILFGMILAGCTLSWASRVPGEERRSYAGYQAFRVHTDNGESMDRLHAHVTQNFTEVIDIHRSRREALYLTPSHASAELQALLRQYRAFYHLEHRDFGKVIASEKKLAPTSAFSWDAYHDIDRIESYLKERSQTFSNSTQLVKGGQSYQGRNITGLRICTPTGAETKPAIVIESGIHAREWITPAVATYLIEQLLTSQDPVVQDMKDRFDWHIFPTINPDGYHYTHHYDRMWRKSRSESAHGCFGADLNRNWDHNWGKHSASSDPCNYGQYAGARPFSEVETRSFASYVAALPDLRLYVALHAYAQMLLLPYSDSTEHCDNYDDLIQIGKKSLEYGKKVNGAKYYGPSTAAEILYKVSGGSMDWVRETLGTPLVFTYEMRGRNFAWPPARIPEQGRELVRMLSGLLDGANDLGYF